MSLERVDELLREFGSDVMLLIGGNLLAAAPSGGASVQARAAAFVRRVHETRVPAAPGQDAPEAPRR